MTLAEGAWLSSTIRSFSTVVHRRRRSGPDRTETLLTFAHLLANQSANYCRQGCRPEGGPHRRVTVNLKPAREMGMKTIKVTNAPQVINKLERVTVAAIGVTASGDACSTPWGGPARRSRSDKNHSANRTFGPS
jgi:hypothetical protein